MQHPSSDANEQIIRRLDRLEDRLDERTKNLATRGDLEALRRELVAQATLEPMISSLKDQIIRVDADRVADRRALEKRIDKVEDEPLSRSDRLWMRLGQAAAVLALALTLFQFLVHYKFFP